jgi:hypothetical protein
MTETAETRAFALHLEEYKALRAEILSRQAARARMLQIGVAAIVAIWAYLATTEINLLLTPLALLAWWLPVIIALAALVINYIESAGVKQAGAYLAMIETRYGFAELGGWENTLIRLRNPETAPPMAERESELSALYDELVRREKPKRYSTRIHQIWLFIAVISAAVAAVANVLVLASRPVAS